MTQVPKAHVRQALVAAAREVLGEAGYRDATLATVAARAGTSIGNLYKYFGDKEDLLAAAVPPELVREVGVLLRRRFESLGGERDVGSLAEDHPYRAASGEFLDFAIAHRQALVFLLRHARGTAYATFGEDLISDATKHALRYAERAYPAARFTASHRRALSRIYRAFFDALAAVLDDEHGRRGLREAVAQHTTYHLAGLQAFFRAADRSPAET